MPPLLLLLTFVLIASLSANDIEQQAVTSEELASALGIRSFCADFVVKDNSYPRLIAEVKDQNGKITTYDVTPHRDPPGDIYRIRIFLFEDNQTRIPKRVIFNLSSEGNIAGNAFIDFPDGSRLAKTSISKSKDWFYQIWILGPNAPKDFFQVTFRVETSNDPYPLPSASVSQGVHETKP